MEQESAGGEESPRFQLSANDQICVTNFEFIRESLSRCNDGAAIAWEAAVDARALGEGMAPRGLGQRSFR